MLVATQSEGLLLRPGKLVQIRLEKQQSTPSDGDHAQLTQSWHVMGESETSLWSVLAVPGGVLASDYKGRVLKFHEHQVTPIEVEARWIRSLVAVPGCSDQILAGTEDGKLLVLSTEQNSEMRRMEVCSAAIFDIAFRKDAAQIAVACGDGSIHIRSWPELEAVHLLPGQGHAAWAVRFLDDGQHLVSGGADRKIRLWDATSGQPVVVMASTADWVTSMIELPQSSLIAAGCLNGQIVLLDYQTLLPVQHVQAAASGIWAMSLSPSGKQLALATRRHGLILLEDTSPWYEAGKAAAIEAASNRPPEPSVDR